jgi:hypothetical protein
VSIGLSRIAESVEDAVAISRLASGAVDVSTDVLGKAPTNDGPKISASGAPRIVAKNDRKKVSSVRRRIV